MAGMAGSDTNYHAKTKLSLPDLTAHAASEQSPIKQPSKVWPQLSGVKLLSKGDKAYLIVDY